MNVITETIRLIILRIKIALKSNDPLDITPTPAPSVPVPPVSKTPTVASVSGSISSKQQAMIKQQTMIGAGSGPSGPIIVTNGGIGNGTYGHRDTYGHLTAPEGREITQDDINDQRNAATVALEVITKQKEKELLFINDLSISIQKLTNANLNHTHTKNNKNCNVCKEVFALYEVLNSNMNNLSSSLQLFYTNIPTLITEINRMTRNPKDNSEQITTSDIMDIFNKK